MSESNLEGRVGVALLIASLTAATKAQCCRLNGLYDFVDFCGSLIGFDFESHIFAVTSNTNYTATLGYTHFYKRYGETLLGGGGGRCYFRIYGRML